MSLYFSRHSFMSWFLQWYYFYIYTCMYEYKSYMCCLYTYIDIFHVCYVLNKNCYTLGWLNRYKAPYVSRALFKEEFRDFTKCFRVLRVGFSGELWRILSWFLSGWHLGNCHGRGFELCVGSQRGCEGNQECLGVAVPGAVTGAVPWISGAASTGLHKSCCELLFRLLPEVFQIVACSCGAHKSFKACREQEENPSGVRCLQLRVTLVCLRVIVTPLTLLEPALGSSFFFVSVFLYLMLLPSNAFLLWTELPYFF